MYGVLTNKYDYEACGHTSSYNGLLISSGKHYNYFHVKKLNKSLGRYPGYHVTEYSYGSTYVRIIINSSVSKTYKENSCVTELIIVGDRHYLYNPLTVKKFNLKIDARFISNAGIHGEINFLEWWKNNYTPLLYNPSVFLDASANGQVEVLEWWKKSGLFEKYSPYAIKRSLENASYNGHVNVLEWWKNSGFLLVLDLEYSQSSTKVSLNSASYNGHIHVLEWWKNSGLPLIYDEYALKYACEKGHIHVLEWWKNSGLRLIYDDNIMLSASMSHNIIVLEWWLKSNLPIKYTELNIMSSTSYHNYVDVLEWWKNSGLPLEYDYYVGSILYSAIKKNNLNVAKWFIDNHPKVSIMQKLWYYYKKFVTNIYLKN